MQKARDEHREVGPAQRGHLIQRVLVDGWTTAEAAQLIGIDERRVRHWVADYQKRGMASLHSVPVEKTPQRWRAWMRDRMKRLMPRPPGDAAGTAAPVPFAVLNSADQRRRIFGSPR